MNKLKPLKPQPIDHGDRWVWYPNSTSRVVWAKDRIDVAKALCLEFCPYHIDGTIEAELDVCPSTLEENCHICSGEYCNIHNDRPCDCDVAERHKRSGLRITAIDLKQNISWFWHIELR